MKMQAAVMTAPGAPLRVREVELAGPKANEVLVKIKATAVCHSDLNALTDPTTPIPQVLGHEGAGVVAAIGDQVTGCQVGDEVALSWVPYCGNCVYCRVGKVNLCESAFGPIFAGTLLDGTSRMTLDGQCCYHMSLLSTFAEYAVVPEMSCVKLPTGMNLVAASMIGCGVATGYGAAVRAARITPGSSVAIFGIGGVGLNAIQGARIAGATRIIACDLKDENLRAAHRYGATHVVNTGSESDPVQAIKELSEGLGVEYAIDCTGNTKAGAMAWRCARRGGTVVVIGAYPTDGELVLPAAGFHRWGKILRGSFYGDVNAFEDFPAIAELYLAGRYDLDSLVINTITLDEINQAMDAFNDPGARNTGRYVIVFD